MPEVSLVIDDVNVSAPEGWTILEATRKADIYVPALCGYPSLPSAHGMEPNATVFRDSMPLENTGSGKTFAGCQLCVVEVDGEGVILACTTPVKNEMFVHTSTLPVLEARRKNLAKILAVHPHACLVCPQQEGCDLLRCSSGVPKDERCCRKFSRCELRRVAEYIDVAEDIGRYAPKNLPVITDKLIVFDYNLCIGCLRCVRVCRDMQGVGALGFVYQDGEVTVGTVGRSLKDSGCKFCGACIEVCPTGTLMDAVDKAKAKRVQKLKIPPPVLPPEKWLEFTESNVAAVPEDEGVYQLLDAQKNVIYIKGIMNLQEELKQHLNSNKEVRYFLYEEAPMYTSRESELLQQFLQQHGKLPPQNADLEDIFD